jgi:3,4-dihydroxy 2-butanone 4-phosphate synthase/GTP cyclohydrolase II
MSTEAHEAQPVPLGGHRTVRDLPEGFSSVEEAVAAISRGEIVVVVDDEDRENEGDLIMAAEHVTPEKIAFFLHHTSGFICAPITSARASELDLSPMVEHNPEAQRTAFLVSVDLRQGTTTGISSFDRAATVQALVDPSTRPGDLARPGHILPLEAREGGVLKRAGHTEATVDLARMAGLYPAGILCEIVDD